MPDEERTTVPGSAWNMMNNKVVYVVQVLMLLGAWYFLLSIKTEVKDLIRTEVNSTITPIATKLDAHCDTNKADALTMQQNFYEKIIEANRLADKNYNLNHSDIIAEVNERKSNTEKLATALQSKVDLDLVRDLKADLKDLALAKANLADITLLIKKLDEIMITTSKTSDKVDRTNEKVDNLAQRLSALEATVQSMQKSQKPSER